VINTQGCRPEALGILIFNPIVAPFKISFQLLAASFQLLHARVEMDVLLKRIRVLEQYELEANS
jgi:hypothetical protein